MSDTTRELLTAAAERAIAYLDGLGDRSVAPSPAAIARLAALDVPLPEHPSDPRDVLASWTRSARPATMAMAGPRFFGFVIGGALPGGARRELARRGVGPERRRSYARHAGDRACSSRSRCAGCVDLLGLPRGHRRRLRHRRHRRELHRARRRAPRRARARRLERRGRRPVRRAADHRRRRRRGAPDAAQGARHARPRPHARRARAGRRAGPHARRRAPAARRARRSSACRRAT